jgi:NifU-like protein involved in Fe-S cluster formation
MFNETIVRHFSNPEFAAELDDATASIELGNPVCGDRISVQLQIADGHIRKARYQAWGCATSLAAGNVFCTHINDQPLAAAIATPGAAIDAMLGELDPSQHHCLEMLRTLFAQLPQRAQ